jgi:peptide/nickel transport system substrate-binding protein
MGLGARPVPPRREKDGGFPMRAGLAAWQARKRSSGPHSRARGRRVLAACCAAAGIAALVAACGPASGAASGGSPVSQSDTSTVTYAMQPGGQASYAFPFISVAQAAQFSVYNVNDFQYLMYRPLYWFGTGVNPYLNSQLSLAEPPSYSGHTVTITLKPNYKWSNGESVDAQDVVFWMNMMFAESTSQTNAWIGTTPDGLPGDVTNVRAVSKYVVTMDITSPQYSETWFTNNELSQITPLPTAWDRTATGASDCVTDVNSCNAVYEYLNSQSSDLASYGTTGSLWQVVDGPWRVKSLDSSGNLTLLFNTRYSGPVAPHHITRLVEVPFTTESAEYNVLQDPVGSQTLDVGYLPTVDAPVPPPGANVGPNPSSLSDYGLTAVYPWEISYYPYNFNNPAAGPIFSQLYFRQAFQYLVDQEGVINGPMHGYGKVITGPVATYPQTSYLSPALAKDGDPWTLNIPAAERLLKDHGWVSQGAGKPLVCGNPGNGPTQCGPGVTAGAALNFTLMYATGIDYMESSARELASNASLAGIQINLDPEPFNTVTGDAFDPTNTSWQLAEWGSWTYDPDYLPTGETLFLGGSANNAGNYNNAQNNSDIGATLQARTPSQFDTAMYTWENYLSGQLPVVYMPNAATLVETIKGLDIGPQNSALMITPEMWFYRQ